MARDDDGSRLAVLLGLALFVLALAAGIVCSQIIADGIQAAGRAQAVGLRECGEQISRTADGIQAAGEAQAVGLRECGEQISRTHAIGIHAAYSIQQAQLKELRKRLEADGSRLKEL